MAWGKFRVLLTALVLGLTAVRAAEIDGVVVIKRKLTKRNVTPSVSAYQRGAGVELGSDPAVEDPISFERSRVVIYLEGQGPARASNVSLDQKNRRFVPDTLVIPAGS